jgi:hypothetical protein
MDPSERGESPDGVLLVAVRVTAGPETGEEFEALVRIGPAGRLIRLP